MDYDLEKLLSDELKELDFIANEMGFWPPHFDTLKKEIERKYAQIQDDRIDDIIMN